jgi:hypothetical protein
VVLFGEPGQIPLPRRCAGFQFKIAAMRICSNGDKRLRAFLRPGETEHLMTRPDQLLRDRESDKTFS